ncbi:WD40/YVTN/BNR-like repeat-containing protein [Polyangium sorediatum]|uniref:Uncharacterized protein n=1 Tax=Polyangium sorediatum TaxID=889274 RepID=A0ABT6PBG5_9BACT|nr:hypothetical protein [Polyangium sorediatum]MDI1437612.1 hypothetical protein [Polyangium sorediatum]
MTNRSSRWFFVLLGSLATSACGGGEDETLYELRAVTHGGGRFVAVGYENIQGADPRPLLLSSTDGRSWERNDTSLPQQALHDVAFGNGVFVIVGGSDPWATVTRTSFPVVLTSGDAVAWTSRNVPTLEPIHSVAFGNGLFVITDGAGQTFTSTDGKSFTPQAAIPNVFSISGIAFGAGQFAFWGFHSSVHVSPDAQAFTEHPLDIHGVNCLHFIDGQFQGVGYIGGLEDNPFIDKHVVTSATGEEWATRRGSFPCDGLAESNGVLVAGSGSQLYRSVDGQPFTPTRTAEERHSRLDVTVGDGVFVAVGVDEIDTSTDGQTWTVTPIPR